MKYQSYDITVDGQKTGPAVLHTYLLDAISVSPEKKRPLVIICKGGGYRFRSDREGEPIAMQFLAKGYHACLLEYSVEPNCFPTAVRELALAVALVREHHEEWKVDPDKILICGFSAGGHLCCSLGVFWHREFVYKAIGKTKEEVRPNGMILCYPVITSGVYKHKGSIERLLGTETSEENEKLVSLELQVTDQTPRAFIWHTFEDESVPLENSLLLVEALRKNHVEFEYHIFPKGKHGSSLANEETSGVYEDLLIPEVQVWIELAETWIEGL